MSVEGALLLFEIPGEKAYDDGVVSVGETVSLMIGELGRTVS